MPASTLDPVNAALRTALSKNNLNINLDTQLAGSSKKALLSDIQFESAGSYHNSILDKLKSKYIVLKSVETNSNSSQTKACVENNNNNMGAEEGLSSKNELFSLKNVQLGWINKDNWSVGAGMVNMGNTCYLNSVLQALFHIPSLVNWLYSDKEHTNQCDELGNGLCVICAMRKTMQDSQQRNINSIRPFLIYNKLKVLCKNLIPGRQEDAHEFLRYLVEAMEKSFLNRFKNYSEFDSRTKETTPLNQILGGYLKSTVRCLECSHVSTTFQHFQDLLLDIRKAQTIEEALEVYFARETLDDESYKCEACKKKVPATKQFFLERAPMVLCIQLKRFSVTNNKITKHIQFKQKLELTKYVKRKQQTPLIYRLVAMVTHMGPSVNCGHYTAVAQVSSGNFYQFDDSMVRPISYQAVFSTNAYIMFYELDPQSNNFKKGYPSSSQSSHFVDSDSKNNNKNPNFDDNNNNNIGKVYGPELPPKGSQQNGKTPAMAVLNCNGNCFLSSTSSSDSDQEQSNISNKNKKKNDENRSINDVNVANNGSSNGLLNGKNDEVKKTSSTKLVPYDMDDSSSSSVENSAANQKENKVMKPETNSNRSKSENVKMGTSRVVTKASSADWNLSSSSRDDGNQSLEDKNWGRRDKVVSDLLQMSSSGYLAPVTTWNGSRSQLDRIGSNDKREERKRPYVDDDMDQGRVKSVKLNNNNSNRINNGNGYNSLQDYHNVKNWSQNNKTYNRNFYNNNVNSRHHNGNHRNFHRNKNFHKNYRYRQ